MNHSPPDPSVTDSESSQNGEKPFRVNTDLFRGPADLLLYLVRRHEVELSEIALADVTQQFADYIEILKEIRIDTIGDFIEVLSILVETKARLVLPRNEVEDEIERADPREDLVQRLLLYKEFKDAASLLEDNANRWSERIGRMSIDAPINKVDLAEQPIREVELWDLVSAFGRILRDNRPPPAENIIYDETPIQTYMKRIHEKIVAKGRVSFSELFEPGMHKSAMVGVFLAVLELARYHNVRTEQSQLHSEITIVPAEGFSNVFVMSDVDDYNPHKGKFAPGDPSSLVE